MKKEEELSRKLSLLIIPIKPIIDDTRIAQNETNEEDKFEIIPPAPSHLQVTSCKQDIRIIRANSISRTNLEEIHKKKSHKTEDKNILQQIRRVPMNTPTSSNSKHITKHGRIINVKKLKNSK